LSVLSIPRATGELEVLVEQNWETMRAATSIEILTAFRTIGRLGALEAYGDEDILSAVQTHRDRLAAAPAPTESEDILGPEWNALTHPETATRSTDFSIRASASPPGYESLIRTVVLADRLREVWALTGFTRIEAPELYMEGPGAASTRQAPLTRQAPRWVPSGEVRGEGFLVVFDEAAISAWGQRPAVGARLAGFVEAHRQWRRARRLTPVDAGFPGARYILLHSFAHALMRQLALECGYSAASIRERIYARDPGSGEAMAGVLFYTAASDSEGTLGGLVSLGEPRTLARHMDQMLAEAELCASDPLCSEHAPGQPRASLHGAACHACLFAPETSCERGNRYLDRSFLVPTFNDGEAAFFSPVRASWNWCAIFLPGLWSGW
jgi:hypothetical protein